MSNVTQRAQSRLIAMALRYCEADRTDPFAFNRAMTHIRNGIATLARPDGEEACYTADAYEEDAVTLTGERFKVRRHKNIKRP